MEETVDILTADERHSLKVSGALEDLKLNIVIERMRDDRIKRFLEGRDISPNCHPFHIQRLK